MTTPITDEEMERLKVVDTRVLQPDHDLRLSLCRNRGIDLRSVIDGKEIFVDDDLGYLILREDLLEEMIRKATVPPYFSKRPTLYANWRTPMERDAIKLPALDQENAWYVEQAGGWPEETGEGITVAVIDDGIDEELGLLRNKEDFGSCLGTNRNPCSLNQHGNDCAGAIAAKGRNGQRITPAPDCRIVSAQASRGGASAVWLVDLLLMLSWAVGCRQAKIINMSFCLGRANIEKDNGQQLLSRIAIQLREQNRALVFAAVDNNSGMITYPASLEGFVAVGSYLRGDGGGYRTITGADPLWNQKKELLFAPHTVWTYDNGLFGQSSASCAFLSGVAALYLQKYLGKQHAIENRDNTIEDVLQIMLKNAKQLNPGERSVARYAVQLP